MHIDINIHYKNESLALQQLTITVCSLIGTKLVYMAKLR